jgi:hypothetical protein
MEDSAEKELDVAAHVHELLAETELVDNPVNRTHNYTVRDSDPQHWAAKAEIANEIHHQFQQRYPYKLVDMSHRIDGPGSYLIIVKIKDNPAI